MTASASKDWLEIGKHSARLEAPDVLHIRPHGDVSLQDSVGLMQFVRSLPRPEKGFFGLIDMAHAGRQDPAITKHPDTVGFLALYRAQVFYNATFAQRTVIGIFERVRKFLKSGAPHVPVSIVNTEAEARALIEKFRAQ